MKKIRGLIVCLILGVFSTLCVQAEEEDRVGEETSLTLNCEYGQGVFSLYKVAEFSETGKFHVEEPFANYQIQLEELDSEGWRALAETLEGYVKRDHIEPLDQRETDAKGNIEWRQLEKGLYLALGEQTKDDSFLYTPMPTLITLPNRTPDGEWNNHVSVSLKYEKEDIFQEQEIDFQVIKIWKNEDNTKNRPENITVQLLKDESVYDTIELNKENNWSYQWEGLPLQASWSVVEKEVPPNYTVTSTREGNQFILTNTKKPAKPTEDKHQEIPQKLPQTGQLWWPVPVLAILGAILFVIGYKKYKK